jgi:ribosomal small subunit protein bTHX
MGRGDKKTKKGKRTMGSYGKSRNKAAIKKRLKRIASVKKTVAVSEESKPKAKKTVRKKEGA